MIYETRACDENLTLFALDGTNLGSAFPTRTIRVSRQPKIVEEQLRANL